MRTCFGLVASTVIVLALAAVVWVKRDEIESVLARLNADSTEVAQLAQTSAASGPQLARSAEDKIVALGQGEIDEVVLSPEELDGWVRHGLSGFFPDYVEEVGAAVDEEEKLVLSGRVLIGEVPGLERIGPIAQFLGDTASVSVRGRLDGLAPGRGIYYVDEIQVGPIPLPDRLRDELLANVKAAGDTLPAEAVTFELPAFVTDIAVRNGRVHLRGCPAADC